MAHSFLLIFEGQQLLVRILLNSRNCKFQSYSAQWALTHLRPHILNFDGRKVVTTCLLYAVLKLVD